MIGDPGIAGNRATIGGGVRHQSRLSVECPPGWYPREIVELHSEAHTGVRIEAWALPVEAASAEAIAAGHAKALEQADRPDVTDLKLADPTPIGPSGDALQRWISWTANGRPIRQLTVYRLEDGYMVQASAAGPASHVETIADELSRQLASVTRRPPESRATAGPRRDTLSAFVDGDLGVAPSTRSVPPHGLRPIVLTAEEASAFAKAAGAPGMPGVASTSDEGALQAGRRSLMARGIVALNAGGVEVAAECAATLRGCLEPSVRWSLQRRTRAGQVSTAFCELDGLTVTVRATMPGVYELVPQPGEHTVGAVSTAAKLIERPRADARTVWLEPATLDGLLEAALAGGMSIGDVHRDAWPLANALKTLESVVHARLVHRTGNRQAAADFTWLDAGEHGLWGTQPRTARDAASKAPKALVGIAPTDRSTIIAALERSVGQDALLSS